MATISAKDVMALRKKSGLGMMECKQALEETAGDMEAAVNLLRQRGLAKMDGRSDRESAEGRIASALSADGATGAIIEVNTETDFTASNEAFVAMAQQVADAALAAGVGETEKNDAIQALIDEVRLTTKENAQFRRGEVLGGPDRRVGAYVHFNGKVGAAVEVQGDVDNATLSDLCMQIVAASPTPLGVRDEDVPAEIVERERETAKAQAIESGKPEQIALKIVEGKMRKFFEENTLLKQKFVKDDEKTVQDILPKGATVVRFVRYELGG